MYFFLIEIDNHVFSIWKQKVKRGDEFKNLNGELYKAAFVA